MQRLYFVRHGLSVLNKAGLFAGSTETPLADEGREQAVEAGVLAQGLAITKIIASPMSRAYETAEIIAKQIGYPLSGILPNELLVERHMGILEGTTWSPDAIVEGVEGVEPLDELVARVKTTLNYLHTLPDDNILLVSHGATGRAFRYVLHPETPFDQQERFENAKIQQLI